MIESKRQEILFERYIMEQDGNSTFNYNTLKKPMGAKVKAINKLSGDGHDAPTSPLHNQSKLGDYFGN